MLPWGGHWTLFSLATKRRIDQSCLVLDAVQSMNRPLLDHCRHQPTYHSTKFPPRQVMAEIIVACTVHIGRLLHVLINLTTNLQCNESLGSNLLQFSWTSESANV